jgi:hypothetical protein
VIPWIPGSRRLLSDPDAHLPEYLAMLDAVPRPDLGILSWSQWHAAVRTDPMPADAITPCPSTPTPIFSDAEPTP